MAYLIDTHTLIWYAEGSSKLSLKAKNILDSKNINKFISIASVWEMGIKSQLGKLRFSPSFETFIRNEISLVGYQVLPANLSHIILIEQLELHHKDPFDRLIIAQSITESLPVVTIDEKFKHYNVESIW
ncbi:MAG: type II toxin-antitoxin system VapC family toxin [Bacteroidia bacterium]